MQVDLSRARGETVDHKPRPLVVETSAEVLELDCKNIGFSGVPELEEPQSRLQFAAVAASG